MTGDPGASAAQHFRRLLSGELANKVLRFLAAAVLARGLTAEEFGLFNVGIAVAGIAVTVASLGLAEVGARHLARAPERAAAIAGTVLTARATAFAVLVVPAALVAALLWPDGRGLIAAAVAMTLAMLLTGEWFARGLEHMRTVARSTAAGGLVSLAGAVVVAALSGSAAAGLAAFALAEVAASAGYWTAARRRRPRPGFAGVRPLVREAAPVAVSALAIYAFTANVDTIVLAAARSEAEAGHYSGAYRLFLACNVVATFAAYAYYPQLARAAGGADPAAVLGRLARPLVLLACYGAAVAGTAAVAGGVVLEVAFGADFGAAASALVLLCGSTSWYCVGYVVGYSAIAAGRPRRFTAGAVVAGVVAVVLALLLIPSYGMEGAGAATALAVVTATLAWVGRPALRTPQLVPVWLLLLASAATAVLAVADAQAGRVAGAILLAAAVGLGLERVRGG